MIMFATLIALAAQSQTATPPVAAATPEKPVCRRMEQTTGSTLPGKRVCRPKSEWAQIDAANRQSVEALRNHSRGS